VIVVTNEALATRRRRQAALCSLGGMLVLVAGLAYLWRKGLLRWA